MHIFQLISLLINKYDKKIRIWNALCMFCTRLTPLMGTLHDALLIITTYPGEKLEYRAIYFPYLVLVIFSTLFCINIFYVGEDV